MMNSRGVRRREGWSIRTRSAPANAGRRVGSYELLRELGSGGMGTVWLARLWQEVAGDLSLQRELATAYQKLGDVNPWSSKEQRGGAMGSRVCANSSYLGGGVTSATEAISG